MKSSVIVGLNAVIIAVTDGQPRVLTVKRAEHQLLASSGEMPAVSGSDDPFDALPFAIVDPTLEPTLELGIRERVRTQTGLELGYVEQLYTFGDRNRFGGESARVISIAYLGLTREEPSDFSDARWRDCYHYFPWEDWRLGRPAVLETEIFPAIDAWIRGASCREEQEARKDRAAIVFGFGGDHWDGERVLERYELLYEMGLVTEHHRDRTRPGGAGTADGLDYRARPHHGRWMALDHRRILSTALGRIRGKIKYRPVVFELVPDTFTLFQLQRVVESLSGIPLHKQNFRRLVEKGGLVEATGEMDHQTGGRPAALFRFRREVLRERPSPGVGLPGTSGRDRG